MTPILEESTPYLAIWHDVEDDMRDSFRIWHTRQHLPERISVPGMNRGRRFAHLGSAGEEFCTIINLSEMGVMESDEYTARLNAPTPWTTEISGHYLNFFRCAIIPRRAWRTSYGSFLSSVRIDVHDNGDTTVIADRLWDLLHKEELSNDLVSLSIGVVDSFATAAISEETKARRRTGESVTDIVVFAESATAETSGNVTNAIDQIAKQLGISAASATYSLQIDLLPDLADAVYQENRADQAQGYLS